MEPQQIDQFRKQLLEQREQVSAEMEAHQVRPEVSGEPRDPEEQAVHATTHMVEIRISEDHENLLKKIDFALGRLDAGTYQECAHCGGKIPLERLRAKPSASLCVTCQEAKDSGTLS